MDGVLLAAFSHGGLKASLEHDDAHASQMMQRELDTVDQRRLAGKQDPLDEMRGIVIEAATD